MQKHIYQNRSKKSDSPKPPGSWGFGLHTPQRGLRPQAPDAFGMNPPSQLAIGCHCLTFLKSSLTVEARSRLSPQYNRNFEYKIDHISKTKNRINLKIGSAFVSEHCTAFGTKEIDIFGLLSSSKE